MLIGALFLAIQSFEYHELIHVEKFTPASSLFASCFFTMTGFHGLHVLGGVITMFIVFINSLRGKYTAAENRGIEVAGLYWHFVDLVWIILFTILYLI